MMKRFSLLVFSVWLLVFGLGFPAAHCLSRESKNEKPKTINQKPKAEIDQLIEQLRTGDGNARQQAVQALAKTGASTVPSLAKMLEDSDPAVARWAEMALEANYGYASRKGAMREQQQVEAALLNALSTSKSLKARRTLLRLLSLHSTEQAVPLLTNLLKERAIREEARAALEKTPGSKATVALENALHEATEPEWKIALVDALGARGEKSSLKPILERLRDPNGDVRLAAIRAAGAFPSKEAVDALKQIVGRVALPPPSRAGGTAPAEQQAAADSMLRIAESWVRAGKKAEAQGLYEWFSRDSAVPVGARGAALLGLATLRARDSIPLLIGALRQGDALGKAVHGALAQWDDPSVAQELLKRLPQSKEREQLMILSLLGYQSRSAAQVLPVLKDKAMDDDLQGRVVAIEALARLGDPGAASTVLTALKDPNEGVQGAAFDAVAPIAFALKRAGKTQEAIELAQTALDLTKDLDQMRQMADVLRSVGGEIELAALAARQGFITKWWVLGPFPDRNALRERDPINTAEAPDPNQPVTVGNETLKWKSVSIQDPLGIVECDKVIANRDNVGAYLHAEIYAEAETPALFKIGSDDDVFCWLNGKQVHAFRGDRGLGVDQDVVPVTLQASWNRILVKVLNGGGPWGVCLRVTDREGKPLQLRQK